MEAAGIAGVRAVSQARYLTLIAQSGFVSTAVRQRPGSAWHSGREGMRPGASMPGARASRTSAANWGRTSFPLQPGTIQALQVLLPPAVEVMASPGTPVYSGQAAGSGHPAPVPMA
eukprot:2715275-Alexandrium_andersonii.AAC.1